MYGIFGKEITKYTVIYNVHIRFWPTLHNIYTVIVHIRFQPTLQSIQGGGRCDGYMQDKVDYFFATFCMTRKDNSTRGAGQQQAW